ncbi:sugar ABC transporter permease [Microbacterium deminutum]|uniref:Sugar ABC transporter permease n=1 Tax=Microbacterium deminutum TaxID=344164 RepID=A0ABN2RJ62_9MICO
MNTVAKRRANSARLPSGMLWILPALVVSGGLIYYCIGYTGYISTQNWDGISPDSVSVGLANYVQLWHDPVFWLTILHTVAFFAVTFVVEVLLGLVFAVLLASNVRFGVVYKVLIFLPVLLAPATMAPVFRLIYASDGPFNAFLSAVGLGALAQPWLAQSSTALFVVMSISIWQYTGLAFILYSAALTQIDPQVIEASRVDGAGNARILFQIIWPSVRGTTVALAVLAAIGALKTFDIPYLVTGGGPVYSTEFLGTLIYRVSVPQSQVGYGAALSIVLLVLAVCVALAFMLIGSERKAPKHV